MATLRGGGGIKVLKMYYVVCDWSLNVNKNAYEKLSLGFWVTKIKSDTAGACFQKSGHNQPPIIQDRVKNNHPKIVLLKGKT